MRAGGRRLSLALIVSAAALLCVAPAAAAKGHKKDKGPSAVIRRSAYGIPHIIGRNWEDVVKGYVEGYDLYLKRTGVKHLPASCRGKPWVTPIKVIDAYRRFYQLGLLASQSVAIDGIGGASPPTPPVPTQSTAPVVPTQ